MSSSVIFFELLTVALLLLLLGGLILVLFRFFREPPLRPLEVLKERYARGEIFRDEYQRMRRDIEE